MVTDPIADFLTRARNAQMAGRGIVEIPASNLKKRITEILYDQGYILKYKFEDDSKIFQPVIVLQQVSYRDKSGFDLYQAQVCYATKK